MILFARYPAPRPGRWCALFVWATVLACASVQAAESEPTPSPALLPPPAPDSSVEGAASAVSLATTATPTPAAPAAAPITSPPATTAPASASGTPAAGTVLYPKGPAYSGVGAQRAAEPTSSSYWLVGAFLLALGGGWLLLQKRPGTPLWRTLRPSQKILIEESRSLGNRQYLVVAAFEGRRFLLGVTPGQIQLLSPLDEAKPQP